MSNARFDLQATRAYAAVILRSFFFGTVSYVVYGILLIPYALLFVFGGFVEPLLVELGLIGFTLLIVHNFCRQKLEGVSPFAGRSVNLAHELSYDMVKGLWEAEDMNAFGLFEAAVYSRRGKFILSAMGTSPQEILTLCKKATAEQQIDIVSFIKEAVELKPVLKEQTVDANVIMYQLFKGYPTFKSLLNTLDLSLEDVRKILLWESFYNRKVAGDNPLHPTNISKVMGSVGRSWVMGYTDQLDALTNEVSDGILWEGRRQVVIHRKQLEDALRILSQSTNRNILVMGKVGVGKHTFVENIAYAMRKFEKEKSLPYTRVLMLKTEELLSGTESPDAFLLSALKRAEESGRFVLVIPNMGLILQSADANLKAVFAKFLQARNIYIIGISDTQDYHNYLKKETALDSLFNKITLDDSTEDETLATLMTQSFNLHDRYGVEITYKALSSVMYLSRRYIAKGGLPGKAIDVLQDAVSVAQRAGSRFVKEEHIRAIISQKANVNVNEVNESEKDRLLNLEKKLHEHVVGQDHAIISLVNALKRARLDINAGKRPLGTFLFLGPTGVGKTQTAKALAEEYFGSEDKIIRLDMNEYSNENSVFAITGSQGSGGQHSEAYLSVQVQDNPFSVILLDEIEKAHRSVLNLFLQILDEGIMTDSRGVKTDFRNTIIIATSNAGAIFIRDYFKQNQGDTASMAQFQQELLDSLIKQGQYSPEFINRFDGVILFHPLTKDETQEIAIMMLGDVIHDVKEQMGVTIKVEQDVVEALADHGYSIEFGAREMRRSITNVIETYLADYFLRNNVKRGDEVILRKKDLKF